MCMCPACILHTKRDIPTCTIDSCHDSTTHISTSKYSTLHHQFQVPVDRTHPCSATKFEMTISKHLPVVPASCRYAVASSATTAITTTFTRSNFMYPRPLRAVDTNPLQPRGDLSRGGSKSTVWGELSHHPLDLVTWDDQKK